MIFGRDHILSSVVTGRGNGGKCPCKPTGVATNRNYYYRSINRQLHLGLTINLLHVSGSGHLFTLEN